MTEVASPERRKRLVIVFSAILLLAIITAAVIFVVSRQSSDPEAGPRPSLTPSASSPTPSETPTRTPTPTPSATVDPGPQPPSADDRQHFLEALQSGNTAVFESDFAESIQFAIANSGCCGPLSRIDAIDQLSYVQPGTDATWDFTLDDTTLQTYRDGSLGEYFPVNALVGISSDGFLASFTPGPDGVITAVLVSNHLELF